MECFPFSNWNIFLFFLLKYFPLSIWNIFLFLIGIFSFFSLEYFPFSNWNVFLSFLESKYSFIFHNFFKNSLFARSHGTVYRSCFCQCFFFFCYTLPSYYFNNLLETIQVWYEITTTPTNLQRGGLFCLCRIVGERGQKTFFISFSLPHTKPIIFWDISSRQKELYQTKWKLLKMR